MSYLNAEHYYDPTAGKAIDNVLSEQLPVVPEAEETEDGTFTAPIPEDLLRFCMETSWARVWGNGRMIGQGNWEDYANAIIVQAAEDYRQARKKLREQPKDPEALVTIMEVEDFFFSPWFGMLTTLKGEKLLKMLKEEDAE